MLPATPTDPLLSTVLSGKYRVVRVLGSGGMATVYEAHHVEIGRRVAVKVLHEELAASSALVERFLREARAAAAIESNNICQVYDLGSVQGRPYIVLELLEGESLQERLARVHQLDPQDVVRIVCDIARGLSKAHNAGILHRDLKPENIFLVRRSDGEESAKILDFGLARFRTINADGSEVRLTQNGMFFGTPAYMSPEQVSAVTEIDHRSDLWSLACIVFECLTGQRLWASDRSVALILAQIAAAPIPVPSTLCAELPPTFDAWFAKAVNRERDLRFPTAREFARTLAYSLFVDPFRQGTGPSDDFRLSPVPSLRNPAPDVPVRDTLPAPPLVRSEGTTPLQVSLVQENILRPQHAQLSSSRRPRLSLGSLAALVSIVAGVAVAGKWLSKSGTGGIESLPVAQAAVLKAPAESSAQIGIPPKAIRPELLLESETPPWALAFKSGLDALARGDMTDALLGLERSAELDNSGAARALLEHVRIAAAAKGACRLKGLGRLRSPEARSPAIHSSALAQQNDVLALAVEGQKSNASATLAIVSLDPSLTPRPFLSWTPPQVSRLASAQLVAFGTNTLLFYGETEGSSPGLFLTSLQQPTASQQISNSKTSAQRASAVPGLADDLWIVFAEDPDRGASNIFAQRLDRSLSALQGPLQLTCFAAKRGPSAPRASGPVALREGNDLLLAYRLEREQRQEVLVQRLSLSDLNVATGLPPDSCLTSDRVLGSLFPVAQNAFKVHAPELLCNSGVCWVAWQGEPHGATLLALASSGEVLWRKVLSPRASKVSLGVSETGQALVVWFESGRLRAAPVSKQGVGAASILARVSGEQPQPSIQWAKDSWVVLWTSFESGHSEPYVARIDCRE